MTISSIGSGGRDYSTNQTWEDAFLSVLIAQQIGELYNDSEFAVAGTVVTFAGFTATASFNVILRPATGQGFRDHASVQTNALRYNQSNGVGLRKTSNYGTTVDMQVDYVTLFGLQIAHTGGHTTDSAVLNNSTVLTNCVVDSCVAECTSGNAVVWRSGTFRNSLVVLRRSGGGDGIQCGYISTPHVIANTTIVRPSDLTVAGNGIQGTTGTSTIKNCAVFGFTNFISNVARGTGSNNCTDLASVGFGTSNQESKTYANQFQNTADATRDFRAKTGADLLNNGVTDSTNVPAQVDIVNTARPQGAAWDIGAWELVAAAGNAVGAGLTQSVLLERRRLAA